MSRNVLDFRGNRVRCAGRWPSTMFVAHDVAVALNFRNPRNTLVMLALYSGNFTHTKMKWGSMELFMVDYMGVLELAFRAENEIGKDFVYWLMNVNQSNRLSINGKREGKIFAVTQIAKRYGMTANELNELLHAERIQYKVNDQWVLYSHYQEDGLTYVKGVYKSGESLSDVPEKVYHTYWTEKGVAFIERLMERLGYEKKEQLELFERGE